MCCSEYEELSIGILNQCHEDNDEQTQKILIREQPSFGKLTCIDLAVVADSKRFIAQTGCQSLLNSIWNGRMQPYNSRTSVSFHNSFMCHSWNSVHILILHSKSFTDQFKRKAVLGTFSFSTH